MSIPFYHLNACYTGAISFLINCTILHLIVYPFSCKETKKHSWGRQSPKPGAGILIKPQLFVNLFVAANMSSYFLGWFNRELLLTFQLGNILTESSLVWVTCETDVCSSTIPKSSASLSCVSSSLDIPNGRSSLLSIIVLLSSKAKAQSWYSSLDSMRLSEATFFFFAFFLKL